MLKMWMDDIKLQNCTKDPAYYMFKCPVHVFVAMQNWIQDSRQVFVGLDSSGTGPGSQHHVLERRRILGSEPDSSALWDYSHYEDWEQWAAHGNVKVHKIVSDHVQVRNDKKVLATI